MHVENELVENVTVDDREYEEIIEEYEEEILVSEGVLEPPVTDPVSNTAPAQGKSRCITLILLIIGYLLCIYIAGILWKPYVYIYTY
jgi:hypothetical protein